MSTSARLPRFLGSQERPQRTWLLQFDVASTGVFTHFFQQAAADSSLWLRKVRLVDPALGQGSGNRRRSGGQAEAVQNLLDRLGRMDGSQNPHAATALRALENSIDQTRRMGKPIAGGTRSFNPRLG